MLAKLALSGLVAVTLIFQCSRTVTGLSESADGAKMLWSDEFDYEGAPDAAKWDYDLGDGCPHICGWGNEEEEYYTNKSKNVRVKDGFLVIEAHAEPVKNSNFTSARLVSRNKNDWKYGKVEVRAKLPQGLGTWPAVWMLPTENKYGGWPKSGEIDIMEHVGYARDTVFGTIHTQSFNHMHGTQKGGEVFAPTVESEFHLYTLNWTPDKMEWFIDNVHYFTFDNEHKTTDEWPFDQDFHLLINLAVGGKWGGKHGVDKAVFPQQFLVDYVRVYEYEPNELMTRK